MPMICLSHSISKNIFVSTRVGVTIHFFSKKKVPVYYSNPLYTQRAHMAHSFRSVRERQVVLRFYEIGWMGMPLRFRGGHRQMRWMRVWCLRTPRSPNPHRRVAPEWTARMTATSPSKTPQPHRPLLPISPHLSLSSHPAAEHTDSFSLSSALSISLSLLSSDLHLLLLSTLVLRVRRGLLFLLLLLDLIFFFFLPFFAAARGEGGG
jgi:hypothetical protein